MNSRYFKLIICFFLIISLKIKAGDNEKQYAVNNIPKNLLHNANAVVRSDQMMFNVDDIEHSTVKIKHAVTLLNEKAASYRFYRIPYNKFIKVSGIKANIYDGNGELLLTIHPNIRDVKDNYEELASDSYYWFIAFPIRKYPFTVEIEYEKTNTGSFFYDDWGFQSKPDVSVQQSGAQFVIKKGLGFRVHEANLKQKCDTFSLADKTVYTWQEENIPAIKTEDLFSISYVNRDPVILTAPNNFVMGGIKGNMESWESYGTWVYTLNKDRDIISGELQTKLKTLTANKTDIKEIVKILYQYLQKNTRYVGIQLGIGGYQTLEASFVEKKGYGDCKALTNYLKAMLKSVGIPSHQALIYAEGDEDIIKEFPSQQFNHVILCVPLAKDTIWLECTNQTYPFNFLGRSLNNKHVLLLTENGGKLVRTPHYKSNGNKLISNFVVNLDIKGHADIKGKMKFVGLAYQRPMARLSINKKETEDYINDLFVSPDISVKKIDFQEDYNIFPEVNVNFSLSINGFVSKTKKRMVFLPNLFDPIPYLPKISNKDFKVLPSPLLSDTVNYILPFGYIPEFLPETINLETRFGKYFRKFYMEKEQMVMIRQFEVFEQTYDQNDFEEFSNFFSNVATTDKEMVLIKKE